jgi:hypothetical protein
VALLGLGCLPVIAAVDVNFPATAEHPDWVELVPCGPNYSDPFRPTAQFVENICAGPSLATLVKQPTKFAPSPRRADCVAKVTEERL